MTAEQLANIALSKLGVSQTIADVSTDETPEATAARTHFDTRLRACLRRFPWPFATKYADLYLVQGPVFSSDSLVQPWTSGYTYAVGDVVASASVNYRCILAHATDHQPPNATYWELDDSTDEANGDWRYAYREPSDCVFARRILSDAGLHREFDANPMPFRIGRDANGHLIYSNKADATLEYTVMTCDGLYADDLFVQYFTWDLAAHCAPTLSRNGLKSSDCTLFAEQAFALAATVASREQQQEKPGEAEWISGR